MILMFFSIFMSGVVLISIRMTILDIVYCFFLLSRPFVILKKASERLGVHKRRGN